MTAEAENDPFPHAGFEQAVRETAYFLWEQDGRPEGREQEYWFRALERALREWKANQEIGRPPSDRAGGSTR